MQDQTKTDGQTETETESKRETERAHVVSEDHMGYKDWTLVGHCAIFLPGITLLKGNWIVIKLRFEKTHLVAEGKIQERAISLRKSNIKILKYNFHCKTPLRIAEGPSQQSS